MPGPSSRSSVRRQRRARTLAPAAPPPPLALAGLRREQHARALGLARALEPLPPLREIPGSLAARAAQQQEVVPRAELLVDEQREGPATAALLEARLQRPDLLHHRGEAAWNRELVGLDVEHPVHGLEQGGNRLQARGLLLPPRGEYLVPEERREQERGRHALAGAYALVGLLEGELHEALAHRLLE